jgi:hypothetical protein
VQASLVDHVDVEAGRALEVGASGCAAG